MANSRWRVRVSVVLAAPPAANIHSGSPLRGRFRYRRPLTLRELEVLRRLAAGETTVEVAASMSETPDATRYAIRSASAKLDART
jgi:DNA-binding CsgD family transcriptional regulator